MSATCSTGPIRTLVSVFSVAVELVMILSIVGIMIGELSHQQTQTNGIGADIIMHPPNSSFLSAVGGAPVPAKIADVLAKLPHVAVAAPVIADLSTVGSVETIWGIRLHELQRAQAVHLPKRVDLSPGPNDVIIDDYAAQSDRRASRRRDDPDQGPPLPHLGDLRAWQGRPQVRALFGRWAA